MLNLYEFNQTLNVLIVEDDEKVLNQLKTFFQRRFTNVDTALNGQEAFEKYFAKLENENKTYDIIFCDICMPKLDGMELLKKIRLSNKDSSIVFATARNESHKILEAMNFGVNGYLVKPLDYDLLALEVSKVTKELYFRREFKRLKDENEILNNF